MRGADDCGITTRQGPKSSACRRPSPSSISVPDRLGDRRYEHYRNTREHCDHSYPTNTYAKITIQLSKKSKILQASIKIDTEPTYFMKIRTQEKFRVSFYRK